MNTPDTEKCEYCSAREQEHGYGVICEHTTPDTEKCEHDGNKISCYECIANGDNTPNTTLDGETCDIPHHEGMNTPDTEGMEEKMNSMMRMFTPRTPDTEWEKEAARIAIEASKLTKNYAQFSECIYQGIKSVVTSRDTYWKERVRKVIKTVTPVYQGRGAHLREIGGGEMKKILLQALDNLK